MKDTYIDKCPLQSFAKAMHVNISSEFIITIIIVNNLYTGASIQLKNINTY